MIRNYSTKAASSQLLLLLLLYRCPVIPIALPRALGECVCAHCIARLAKFKIRIVFVKVQCTVTHTVVERKQSIFDLNVGQSLIYSPCLFATIFRNQLSQCTHATRNQSNVNRLTFSIIFSVIYLLNFIRCKFRYDTGGNTVHVARQVQFHHIFFSLVFLD